MDKTLHIKEFDTSTNKGFKRAIKWEEENPDWKLLTPRIELTWYYELEEINGQAWSNELNEWVDVKELGL